MKILLRLCVILLNKRDGWRVQEVIQSNLECNLHQGNSRKLSVEFSHCLCDYEEATDLLRSVLSQLYFIPALYHFLDTMRSRK